MFQNRISIFSRIDYRSVQALAVVAAVIAAFWPVFRWYGRRLFDGSDDPWGLAAFSLALYFLWERRGELRSTQAGRFTAAGIVALYAALYPWLPALVRGLLMVICLALVLGLTRRGLAIVGLMALSLPIMASVQFYFGYPLRVMVAAGCEFLVETAGWDVAREGTGLLWRGEQVMVDAPCSGVRILWTGLVAHFGLSAYFRVEGARLVLTTICACILLLAANVVRATILFFPESGVVSWPASTHELTGLLVFASVVFLLIKLQELTTNGKEVRRHAIG